MHICIPNGPLRFLIRPYNATESHFGKEYNFIVFAYDWRRPLSESAGYFQSFLKRMKDRVLELRQEDPLPTTTILCHSMGGLVAKVFLHRVFKPNATEAQVAQQMERLVTVATPFYGTATHMRRYYKGEDPLNLLYTAASIARISGTLPGPYVLMFLDWKTYKRVEDKLEIGRYPVRDAEDTDSTTDPHDPDLIERFPSWVRKEFLLKAARMHGTIARDLPDPVAERVFHIRSVKANTAVELNWRAVDGKHFDPDIDDSPITGKIGAGDGTVPFWAARLVQIPDSQVFDLKLAGEHMELLEHAEMIEVIDRLIKTNRLPRTVGAPDKLLSDQKASKMATMDFIAEVSAGNIKRTDVRATDDKLWRRIVQEINLC